MAEIMQPERFVQRKRRHKLAAIHPAAHQDIHLPFDIWMNVDMQWMSAGNSDNTYQKSSSYLNAKLYKAFFNNRFSITIEANDIFNKSNRDVTLMSKDVTIYRLNTTNNRTFMLTLQYTFNSTRDRYRGQGAGINEMNRF